MDRVEYITGSSPYGPDARRPFRNRPIGFHFSLTSLSTAITKVSIGLGYVFLVTSEFSLHESRGKYALGCCGQK